MYAVKFTDGVSAFNEGEVMWRIVGKFKTFKFTPDASEIVTVSYVRDIQVWNANTGEFVRKIPISKLLDRDGLVLSPDGSAIMFRSVSEVRVYDYVTGDKLLSFMASHLSTSVFTGDSRSIVTLSAHGELTIRNTLSGAIESVEHLTSEGGIMWKIKLCRDGRLAIWNRYADSVTFMDNNFNTTELVHGDFISGVESVDGRVVINGKFYFSVYVNDRLDYRMNNRHEVNVFDCLNDELIFCMNGKIYSVRLDTGELVFCVDSGEDASPASIEFRPSSVVLM
jgi:WD40 repeat protein